MSTYPGGVFDDALPEGRAAATLTVWRHGVEARLEAGKVYKVTLQPLTTSNWFAPGHRLRIEVSSSNFPRFDRNLNTGGNNCLPATRVHRV